MSEINGKEEKMVEIEKVAPPAVVPLLGLIVDLNKPNEVGQALRAVRDAKRQLDNVRAELERVLAEEAHRLGTKTLHLDGFEAIITGGPEIEYDVEVLEQLLDAGLPQERFDALVKTTITYKVDKNVLRQVLGSGNAEYALIIGKAASEVEKPWRVSVR